MKFTTDQLRQLDKAHLWHPFTHMSLWLDSEPLVITRAQVDELVGLVGQALDRTYAQAQEERWV